MFFEQKKLLLPDIAQTLWKTVAQPAPEIADSPVSATLRTNITLWQLHIYQHARSALLCLPEHSLGHKNSTYVQVWGAVMTSSHYSQLLCSWISSRRHRFSITAAAAQGSGLNF